MLAEDLGADTQQDAADIGAATFGSMSATAIRAGAADLLAIVKDRADKDLQGAAELIRKACRADGILAALCMLSLTDCGVLLREAKRYCGGCLDLSDVKRDAKAAAEQLRQRTQQHRADDAGGDVIDRRDPLGIADKLLARRFTDSDDRRTLRYIAHDFYRYVAGRYVAKDPEAIRQAVYDFTSACIDRDGGASFRPDAALVSNVMDALRARTLVDSIAMPCWSAKRPGLPDERDVIAFANGLLDVSAWLANAATPLLPLTPDWVSTTILPYAFDATAACPEWERFIAEVSGGDADFAEALRMWMGYNLTSDTRQQKFLAMIGVPRAGKGTAGRVFRAVVGAENVVSPTLMSLGAQFGLAPLVGKSAAILFDAHLDRGSMGVLERLKSITGEDPVNIDIKHKASVDVKLATRFTIMANDLPSFHDPSGALAARMIVLAFNRSFQGREDRDLERRLMAELPGIANWSLAGLRLLRERGRLTEPATGAELVESYHRLSAPVYAFVKDSCVLEPSGWTDNDSLWHTWNCWREENGREAMGREKFFERLRSACDGKVNRVREDGPRDKKRRWGHGGIRFRTPDEVDAHWTVGADVRQF